MQSLFPSLAQLNIFYIPLGAFSMSSSTYLMTSSMFISFNSNSTVTNAFCSSSGILKLCMVLILWNSCFNSGDRPIILTYKVVPPWSPTWLTFNYILDTFLSCLYKYIWPTIKLLQLLGGEVFHYHTKLIPKQPRTGGVFQWHQDYGYWYNNGNLTPDLNTVYIAVDRCDTGNGCIEVKVFHSRRLLSTFNNSEALKTCLLGWFICTCTYLQTAVRWLSYISTQLFGFLILA